MARKFLYVIALIIIFIIFAGFVLRLYQDELTQFAFVPDIEFTEIEQLKPSVYDGSNMWFSRGDKAKLADNPTLWKPDGLIDGSKGDAAIFFIHPTSYLGTDFWNAPLDDEESQNRARLFLRGMASVFNNAGEIWAPKYRQAAFGSFLTDAPEGQMAQAAAYEDILLSFDRFIGDIDPSRPIILAGHSQGSLHLMNLLKDRVADKPIADRIAAAYVVGWPISITNDAPYLGLPACKSGTESGCILSWQSYAEPADYQQLKSIYEKTIGFDGKTRAGSTIICTNPIAGALSVATSKDKNSGTLVPNSDLSEGELVKGSVPAHCNPEGFLLIGDPPELGPYVLPGNNYHVYDYPLFWANVRQDAMNRLNALKSR